MSSFEGWAILELMGHRRLAGRVQEVEQFGAKMCRIDVPGAEADQATQFYNGSAVYCLTPTTEETARRFAQVNRPGPVALWELLPPVKAEPRDLDTSDDLSSTDADDDTNNW
ncbi:MAG TPA: hypothetical protein VFQ61_06550 [Polyangiaceae bacterium]|nr:hypothetical protein [Polyangiaceae bacterium]